MQISRNRRSLSVTEVTGYGLKFSDRHGNSIAQKVQGPPRFGRKWKPKSAIRGTLPRGAQSPEQAEPAPVPIAVPRGRPAIRIIFELYALALRNPQEYPGVLEDPLVYWQKLAKQAGISSNLEAVEATLLLACTRGLLLDLCATGDRTRVGRAMELLAQLVESRPPKKFEKN